MKTRLFRNVLDECPYGKDAAEAAAWYFHALDMDGARYESLLVQGWRRCGPAFYRNDCADCELCRPIRVSAKEFSPSKSQRRTLRSNGDLTVTVDPSVFREEDYQLYLRYNRDWHESKRVPERDEFRFFIDSPLDTRTIRYFMEDELIGVGWIDVLPNSISSVYFAFEPRLSKRRLGVFSLLRELELCDEWGKSWLQLGFHVPDCPKMDYKSDFKPCQIAVGGEWRECSFVSPT